MMILPIKDIREEDGPTIGADLLHLGQLHHAGIPVPEGIIISAPEIHLKTVLEHFELENKEIFEQRLTLIKEEIAKIPPPEELEEEFSKRNISGAFLRINHHKLWLHLLDFWLSQIRSRIWREGFSPNLTKNLLAQPVFFMDKITSYGKAYFDYDTNKLVIEAEHGTLSDKQVAELEAHVKLANKKLLLPQIYDWSLEKKLFFVKVTPFTNYPAENKGFTKSSSQEYRKVQKSSIKVFLNLQDNFRIEPDLDGAILSSEVVSDFDAKLLQLIEAAQTLHPQPIIFKLFDRKDKLGKVRGAQYLIHEKQTLKKDVEAIHFLRNNKNYNNIHVAIPFVRSPQELKELKQDLLALKITRSATLKLWVELAVPENLLNIEKYTDAGFDGALLNCDSLASWIGGFDPEEPDSVYYKSEIEALLKLVEQSLSKLHKEKIPVIATGSLVVHDDVLRLLSEKGIWGLILNSGNIPDIHERIRLIERRILHKNA